MLFLAKQPKLIINNHIFIKMNEPRIEPYLLNQCP